MILLSSGDSSLALLLPRIRDGIRHIGARPPSIACYWTEASVKDSSGVSDSWSQSFMNFKA